MHKLSTKQLIVLAGILIVLVILVSFFVAMPSSSVPTTNAPATMVKTTPSPQVIQQLKAEPTFQQFVSYTNQGFEPAALTVKQGNTVRFTNNSSEELWIASVGKKSNPIYPGKSDCGNSSFDSCGPLQPGDFWQFTFTQSGTYYFQNNVDPSKSGIITITVK